MDILRFITAGNVDDGKSTLIGRLLYETKNLPDDLLQSVTGTIDHEINLAHITDGLRTERQQGITIDVAYKYFTTPARKYIITDAPGHFQYTKNLVTGASGVDVIIILIDARNGITEQTRRHSMVASFLNISQIAIAVNKMDAVEYDPDVFNSIQNEYQSIAYKLNLKSVYFIPISALLGDNIISTSENMIWYTGKSLLEYLKECAPTPPTNDIARLSIQYIIHSDKTRLKHGYAGKLLSGTLNVNDKVAIYPSNKHAVVRKIIVGYDDCLVANAGDNVCVYFEDDTESMRGDMICKVANLPHFNNILEATICWLDAENPLSTDMDYLLRINAFETQCRITEVVYKMDIHTFEKNIDEIPVQVNMFAQVIIHSAVKMAYDSFDALRETGRGIIIDLKTNSTVAAFKIAAGYTQQIL